MSERRTTRRALTPTERLEAEARARAWAMMSASRRKPKPKPKRKAVKSDKPQAAGALTFSCPTCGAGVGQYCKTPDGHVHARRLTKAAGAKGQPTRKGSVWAIPSAIETNRRRH
jgi:hypothetical protein